MKCIKYFSILKYKFGQFGLMKLNPDVPGIATRNPVQFCLSISDVVSGILLPTVECGRRSQSNSSYLKSAVGLDFYRVFVKVFEISKSFNFVLCHFQL